MPQDTEINERLSRVEEIIGQLESGEFGREEGEKYYEEGHRLLEEVRDILAGETGDVVEIE